MALYPAEHRDARLADILLNVLRRAGELPDGRFHRFLARGMTALYLSDQKMQAPERRASRKRMLRALGLVGRILYLLVRAVRARRSREP
jgi:tetraprenyl-beta-curcumene synthase